MFMDLLLESNMNYDYVYDWTDKINDYGEITIEKKLFETQIKEFKEKN